MMAHAQTQDDMICDEFATPGGRPNVSASREPNTCVRSSAPVTCAARPVVKSAPNTCVRSSTRVYLDNAATERLLPCVRAAMIEVLSQSTDAELGNAAALHSPGHRAHVLIEEARARVARLINAAPEEIIFTSGGTEANNTVMEIFRGKRVAVSSIEHPSVLAAARARAQSVELIPVDTYGFIDPAHIPTDVDLVSIMLANNELGTLPLGLLSFDKTKSTASNGLGSFAFLASGATKRALEPSAKSDAPVKTGGGEGRAKAKNANESKSLFHSDATQAIGKIPVDVRSLGVDYLSFSAHKIGGPLGVGVLYVRNGAPFTSLLHGGKQESGRRAGTSNVLGIVGLGAAAQYIYEQNTPELYATKVQPLRDELCARILREIPGSSCNSPLANVINLPKSQENANTITNTAPSAVLPNILNMSFAAAEGESIQLYLDAASIVVGTGSACAAGDLRPSHVLMATKHDAEIAHSSVRFSIGLDTTAVDIERVMQVLPKIIQKLQSMSTLKIGDKNE